MATVRASIWLSAVAALAIGTASISAPAQTRGGTVSDIRVEGVQRIEPATVLSYLTIHQGDPFDPLALDASLKALFATGLFSDVVLTREGNELVVKVVENPIINQIAFEGNRRVDDDKLMAELSLQPRQVYTRTRVQNDTQRILDIYRRSGRFQATVEPKIIQLDQNRVDLVFEINEGPLATIEEINFVGNEAFSDSTLRGEVVTEETEWWNILATTDTYDPDRLAFDQELLRRFYLREGYADFRVVSAVAELSPDGEGFIITVTVDEGPRYHFGKMDVVSAIQGVDVEQLRPLIVSQEGDWYSSTDIEASVNALRQALGDMQYAFVDIKPRIDRDRDAQTIGVTYEIAEGPRVFVERIDIEGNTRTLDEVIRREFRLVEGDPFNATLLRTSESRIRNLGYFSNVQTQTLPGSAPDQTIIRTTVTEQSTGELTLGAGFSSTDGPLGNVSLRERNFLGRGQDIRFSTSISGVSSEFDISFTEPYFMGREVAAGFDLFHTTRDNQSSSSYSETNTGFALRLGYPLSETVRQTLRYRLALRSVEDVPNDASVYIKEQEGEVLTSAIASTISWDERDSKINPTDGFVVSMTNELAGLGGDVHYFKTVVNADWYYPITDSWIVNVGVQGGYIYGIGEDVRISDRFFVGGQNMRGFATGGIGPRDLDTGDALGGNAYAIGTLETLFPVGLPDDFGIKGRAFTEFGTLFGADVTGGNIVDEPALRLSAGVGISWDSPFGPVKLDFAIPILKEDYDETEEFRFSFGTSF